MRYVDKHTPGLGLLFPTYRPLLTELKRYTTDNPDLYIKQVPLIACKVVFLLSLFVNNHYRSSLSRQVKGPFSKHAAHQPIPQCGGSNSKRFYVGLKMTEVLS